MTEKAGAAGEPGAILDLPGGNLLWDVFVLSQHVGTLVGGALDEVGLSASQYAVYSALAHGPGTPTEVSRLLGVPAATLSGHLKAMQQAGHLTRTRAPGDGRSSVLALTEAGRATHSACREQMAVVVRRLDRELGGAGAVTTLRAELARLDRAVTAVSRTGDHR